ncbi:MAG: DUF309 domain-containing protein [Pirellulales bacterium]
MADSDAPNPPRLAPEFELPPYSYVSGHFPHPTRDPAGHSFGHAPPQPAPLDPANWGVSRDYLFGCDLFNHGYYWEAHEVWEGLWKACGRHGPTADFLKALIKLAAAGVKHREGRAAGVRRHAARAVELFEAVAGQIKSSTYAGLDLQRVLAIARRLDTHLSPPVAADARVAVVFDFTLLPEL